MYHAVLPDPAFVSAIEKKTGSLVLRGVELNVFLDAWSIRVDPERNAGISWFLTLAVALQSGAHTKREQREVLCAFRERRH